MAANPRDRRQCAPLVGYLTCEANGYPQTVSHNTRDTYRALARRYGLTAVDFVHLSAPTIRLDWTSASVVEDAA